MWATVSVLGWCNRSGLTVQYSRKCLGRVVLAPDRELGLGDEVGSAESA